MTVVFSPEAAMLRSQPVKTVLPWAVILALLGAIIVSSPMATSVWTKNAFHDSDDIMRIQQVRDLLAGQSWFDMTVRRLDPPGVFTHWSRIVDAPLALLIKGFEIVVDAGQAERLTRIVFPLVMQGALYTLMGLSGRLLSGASAIWPAVLIGFLGAPMFSQFQPGRVDHHAPQIVLLMAAFFTMAAAFNPARARLAGLSGVAIALSLGISLENLPFIAVLLGAPFLAFVRQGVATRRLLLWTAAGLGAGLILVYAATVAPSRWTVGVCDALSIAQFLPFMGLAASAAMLAALAPRLPTGFARFAAVAVCGGLTLAGYVGAYPECLGDPLVATDPLVRQVWLSNVSEAFTIWRLAGRDVGEAATLFAATALGLGGAIACVLTQSDRARARWLLLATLILVGLALGSWQIRAFSSVLPLAGLGAVGGALALARRGARRHALAGGPFALLIMLTAASPLGWTIATASSQPAVANGEPRVDKVACFAAENLQSLAALPAGLALSHIDAGPFIIGRTPHAVLGAPYHRNNHGNRAAIEMWRAPDHEARKDLAQLGVRYVFYCPGAADAKAMAPYAGDSLLARFEAGRLPNWLREIESDRSAYRAFEIVAPATK